MYLIVGLGNPGKQYEQTRHNIGFDVIDYMANKYNIDVNREKFKGICGEGFIENKKVILLKPLTYMNLSGEAISLVMNYYKIKDVFVIYDDISLDTGKVRFRASGSDGGHNGIKSVISHLGTKEFDRLKIGIGPQPNIPSEAYVLQNFTEEQLNILKPLFKSEMIENYLSEGLQKCQNMYN